MASCKIAAIFFVLTVVGVEVAAGAMQAPRSLIRAAQPGQMLQTVGGAQPGRLLQTVVPAYSSPVPAYSSPVPAYSSPVPAYSSPAYTAGRRLAEMAELGNTVTVSGMKLPSFGNVRTVMPTAMNARRMLQAGYIAYSSPIPYGDRPVPAYSSPVPYLR